MSKSRDVHPTKTRTQIGLAYIGPSYFLLNFIAHAYAAREAVIMPVYGISVIRWRIVSNTVATQKIVFFQERGIGRQMTVEREFTIYPQLTKGSGGAS